nr:hypothetical protein [Tanacetum cinerariifolium]
MAPKSSQAVVLPKFDMHIHTSNLTTKELKEFVMEYCIPTDLHPRLPPLEFTMNKLSPSLSASGTVILNKGYGRESACHGCLFEAPRVTRNSSREKKDQQNLSKAQAKRTGEGGSVTPQKKRVRKNQEPAGSGSEGTLSATTLHQAWEYSLAHSSITIILPSAHAGHGDAQDNVMFSDDTDEDAVNHGSYQTRDFAMISVFARSEPVKSWFLTWLLLPKRIFGVVCRMLKWSAVLTNCDAHLGELDRLRPYLQRQMQFNDGLSKKFVLLDNAYSTCSEREMELTDRLKDMEKEMDDWRRTALEQIQVLESEKSVLVAELAQAEMDHHKLIYEFISTVVKRLHMSVEYQISSVAPNLDIKGSKTWEDKHRDLFTMQYRYVQKVVDSYRLPLDALMKVSPDVPPPTANDVIGPSIETTTRTFPKMAT